MNGEFLHKFMVGDISQDCEKVSIPYKLQYSVRKDGIVIGYIDLAMLFFGLLISVEIERGLRRVNNDLRKAATAGAHELWFVLPTPKIREAVKRKVSRLDPIRCRVRYLTLPQCKHRLREISTFPSAKPRLSKALG